MEAKGNDARSTARASGLNTARALYERIAVACEREAVLGLELLDLPAANDLPWAEIPDMVG